MEAGWPARIAAVIIATLVVQTTVLAEITFFDAHLDLMLLIAVSAGLVAGPDVGAIIGFASGLAYDALLVETPLGLTALAYLLAAYCVGTLQAIQLEAGRFTRGVTVALGSALGLIFFAVLGALVGEEDVLAFRLIKVITVVALANALLSPVATRVVRWALHGRSAGEGFHLRSRRR